MNNWNSYIITKRDLISEASFSKQLLNKLLCCRAELPYIILELSGRCVARLHCRGKCNLLLFIGFVVQPKPNKPCDNKNEHTVDAGDA
jgi:hypothetical protein